MKKRYLALSLVLCLAYGGACAQVAVTDMVGRDVALAAPAARVVALSAAECEILCAIGAGETLVARGAYCDWPQEVSALPSVASGRDTNLEQILALRPDLVLTSDMDLPREQLERLAALGVPVAITDAHTIEGVYEAIRLCAALTGREEEAEALCAQMRETFATVKEQAAQIAPQTVYFEVSALEWGLWTAGSGTFLQELAALCGLENIFADVSGWAEVSQEQVISRNPDLIVSVTMYGGDAQSAKAEILARPGWRQIEAVESGRVLCAAQDAFARPGPRLTEAAQTLLAFLAESAAR